MVTIALLAILVVGAVVYFSLRGGLKPHDDPIVDPVVDNPEPIVTPTPAPTVVYTTPAPNPAVSPPVETTTPVLLVGEKPKRKYARKTPAVTKAAVEAVTTKTAVKATKTTKVVPKKTT